MNSNDKLSIVIISKGSNSSRYLNPKPIHLKIAGLFIFLFISASIFSFYYSYKQHSVLNHYKNSFIFGEILQIPENLDKKNIEDLDSKLFYKLKEVENELINMQEILDKKGIKKDLPIGGEYIPADRLSESYLDYIRQDVNNLNEALNSFPLGIPVNGRISSGYGYRNDPFKKKAAFHSGLDFKTKYGADVLATADGVVKKAGWCGGYGKCALIKHKNGFETLYGHMSKVKVIKGQKVKAGDKIGNVGSSGRSTGPHLHYEVIKNKKNLNPSKYLNLS